MDRLDSLDARLKDAADAIRSADALQIRAGAAATPVSDNDTPASGECELVGT